MQDSILNTIKQKNEIIRFVEFLCRKITSNPEEKSNFKKLVALFYLKNIDSAIKVQRAEIEEGIGALSKLKAGFILSYLDRKKEQEAKEYLKQLLNDYKNKESKYLEEIIKIVLIYSDLFGDKKFLNEFRNLIANFKIQTSVILTDYISSLSEEKGKDISIEKWDSSSFDIYAEIIKMRLLFLGGIKIKEKKALYLREHYTVVSEFCKRVNVFELTDRITGDDLFGYTLLALMLRKIGYEEGIFLPDIERINYLQDVIGRESLVEEIKKETENKLFMVVPIVEEKVTKWLPSPLKIFFEKHKGLSFFLRWAILLFLLWSGLRILLTKFGLDVQYENSRIVLSFLMLGIFLGGIIVSWIIKHNLRDIQNLKKN